MKKRTATFHALTNKLQLKLKDIGIRLLQHISSITIYENEATYRSYGSLVPQCLSLPEGGLLLYYAYSPGNFIADQTKTKGFYGETTADIVLKDYDDQILKILDSRNAMIDILDELNVEYNLDRSVEIIANLMPYVYKRRNKNNPAFRLTEIIEALKQIDGDIHS